MCFQHLNVPSPNAPENTVVFSIFAAPDTVSNLQISLSRHKDEIVDLESQTWRYIHTNYIMYSLCNSHFLEERK